MVREGSDFSHVFLSTGGPFVNLTHDALNLTLLEPPCLLPTAPLWTWGLTLQASLNPPPMLTSDGY